LQVADCFPLPKEFRSTRCKEFQIFGGLLLLVGRFVPLGLVLLAPVIVNIDLVHLLLEPSGLPMAAVISILLVFLLWRYRDAFRGILNP